MMTILQELNSGKEIAVITTHLKARKGALLSTLRNEQGLDLLSFLEENYEGRPAIVCGDFNAEQTEPVYTTMTQGNPELDSAYAQLYDGEPPYSTWKIRGDGEFKQTIDYIFYTGSNLQLESGLEFPSEEDIGPNRLPSFSYPSDHFSLVCDFSFRKRESFIDDNPRGRL